MSELDLIEGDLLFACIGSTETDAISAVTAGYRGARLNHVGIALRNARGWFVLEAIPPEVTVTSLERYVKRSAYPVGGPAYRLMIGRLQPEYRSLIPAAIAYGLAKRDTPYDQLSRKCFQPHCTARDSFAVSGARWGDAAHLGC